MAKLVGKIGEWDLPHVHMWKDRKKHIQCPRIPLISSTNRIATIGSCFAAELAKAMDRLQLNGAMHPTGLFYNTRSIRQEIERIFGIWTGYDQEPYWRVNGGFVHAFKDYKRVFPTEEALQIWSDELDRQAVELFRMADIVVITLGLTEAWMQPQTGNYYRQIPHPDVFGSLGAVFHRLSVAQMMDDLTAIRAVLSQNTAAELILTVSPVPLQATLTPLDVRVANCESKSRIRAAVSEFIDRFPDVHYFSSYEIVTTAERLSDFMREDGRHIHRHAVDYILQQFLIQFACDDLAVPELDTTWLTAPSKIAARPRPALSKRLVRKASQILTR
jgi:hypothetical protein